MKKYLLHVKSHADTPDYEDECWANSKEDAAEIFATYMSHFSEEWQAKDLINSIEECSHENTIDVGDEDHIYLMCTDCGKSDRDEYQEELNAQHQANKFDHEAEKLSKKRLHPDALSTPFNDDPKFKSQYE